VETSMAATPFTQSCAPHQRASSARARAFGNCATTSQTSYHEIGPFEFVRIGSYCALLSRITQGPAKEIMP
jgi:hypothetical protein